MDFNDERESFFEEFYANYPEKFNPDWEIYSKQDWVASNLRCDVIYRSKSNGSLHLVEIKRHHAVFPNISQVMEYYAKLKSKGIEMEKVYILARAFDEDMKTAMEYCNIIPLELDLDQIKEIRDELNEEVEGIYKEPLVGLTSITGEFHEINVEYPNGDFLYESYKKKFLTTPQTHYFEIWEYKVPMQGRHYYILSIKHDGHAYHFKHKFAHMAGKTKQLYESTRNFAWDFYKNHCINKPYKNLIIRSYEPIRVNKLADTKKRIDEFVLDEVNPKYH